MKWGVDNLHVFTKFFNQGWVDVYIFNFFEVFCINCFADNFNQARSFFSFHIRNFYSERIVDSTDVGSQSVCIVWRHLSTVFTIYLVSVKRSRVVAGSNHDTCEAVEMTNGK
ncbi:Uncharacterised protein [Mycobacteroides abscessus subsp. abscessus]|nr:Uncharacterised protein [Mycobacteroides abscessus subsp. abscessus]